VQPPGATAVTRGSLDGRPARSVGNRNEQPDGFAGIELLVPLMASLPGQRSIVIVSDGFLTQTLGDEISRISEHALRSQVIINALDARGLYVGEADAETNAYSRSSATPMLNREEALRQSEAMGTLAQDTAAFSLKHQRPASGIRAVGRLARGRICAGLLTGEFEARRRLPHAEGYVGFRPGLYGAGA